MIPLRRGVRLVLRRYPCTSGDDPKNYGLTICKFKLSLHKRGWSRIDSYCRTPCAVIPAQAGMILMQKRRDQAKKSYPCTSGDDPTWQNAKWICTWLSLHKRGWSYIRCSFLLCIGVIPVQAGMILIPINGMLKNFSYPCIGRAC